MEKIEHKIPQSLVFIIPETTGPEIITVWPVDKTRWGKQREAYTLNTKMRKKAVTYTQVIVPNSGFTLSLLDTVKGSITWNRLEMVVRLKVSHPEIDKYVVSSGSSLVLEIPALQMYECLLSSRYITNGVFHGTWCLSIPEGYYNYKPIQETPSLDKDKKVAEIWASSKKTRKWIPGHMYLLKDFRRVLYFGNVNAEIGMFHTIPGSTFLCYFYKFDRRPYGYYGYSNFEQALVIEESDTNLQEFQSIQETSEISVLDYLKEMLLSKVNGETTLTDMSRLLSIGRSKLPSAVDLGEFFVSSGLDITSQVSDIIVEVTENYMSTVRPAFGELCSNSILDHLISRDPGIFGRHQDLQDYYVMYCLDKLKKHIITNKSRSYNPSVTIINSPSQVLDNISSFSEICFLHGSRKIVNISEQELTEKISEIITEINK